MISISFLAVWLILCGYFDLTRRRLPNYLTIGGTLLAIVSLAVFQEGLISENPTSCLMALLLALLISVPGYAQNWLGAGDVKMLMAVGLMTGLQFLMWSFAVSGILAGFVVLYSFLSRRYVPYMNLHLEKLGWQLPRMAMINGKTLPFGTFLAIGGLLMLALHALGMINVIVAA